MNEVYEISKLFILFYIYSVIGYICEVIYCSILDKKFQNRGFLYGPYCPIYGCGAILILYILNRYDDTPILLFVMAALVCSFLEYFTSFLMEKLFNNKWWDYSNQKFNINGRICLKYSIMFGAMGVILTYLVNPVVIVLVNKIPQEFMIILASIFAILMLIDTAVSSNVALKLKKKLRSIQQDVSNYMEEEYRKVKQKQQENKDKLSNLLKDKTIKIFDDKKSKSERKLLLRLPIIKNKNININLAEILKEELNKGKIKNTKEREKKENKDNDNNNNTNDINQNN